MRLFTGLLLLGFVSLLAAQQPAPAPAPLNTPATAVRSALADVQTLVPEARPYARYLWAADNVTEKQLPAMAQTLTFVTNSLSRNSLVVPVAQVNPRLWRIDLAALRISPKAFDNLGKIGSGRVLIPEPYFHLPQVVEVEEDYEYGSYDYAGRWVHQRWAKVKTGKKKVVQAQAPWLPAAEIVQLVAETQSEFPIYRADWFCYYSTLEPRYHELLGLGESKKDFLKLAAVDEVLADKVGVQVRGAVLTKSEVAEHNRSLERTPSVLRWGKGYYWESNDYATSIQKDDVLADLLNDTPAAQELIASLPNGLQAYLVVDGKGKRLDRAAVEVARDKRTPLSSVEVEIRNCITCHATGMVRFEDEVRATATDKIALGLRALEKHDARQAQRIVDRYFTVDVSQLIETDSVSYDAAVKATNGLAGAANALQFQQFLVDYERPLTLAGLAAETGYPVDFVRGAIERSAGTTLDHSVVALANTRPRQARRDQIESVGFGQLLQLLTVGKSP